jgi:D-xylose 1-dehydrogenase (NADP+, D-xylono-1,5-lactone-forming)
MAMIRQIQWGILGAARINQALIPAIKKSSRSRLRAVASRDNNKAEVYTREWRIPVAYGSYEALLNDPEIDVVYIPLPNGLHAEWTIRAAQAGKHVLCEKPLALSLEEVDDISAAAASSGVVVTEAFMYRHHPQTLLVKDMVTMGLIGDLVLIRGSFSFDLQRPGDVRFDPLLGGGSLWDVGCYPINYARFIMGAEPVSVTGSMVLGKTGVDEVFLGQMCFQREVMASLDSSFRMPYQSFMEFIGRQGIIRVDEPFKPGNRTHILHIENGKRKRIPVRGRDLYRGEVEDMERCVLEKASPRVSLDDSHGNIAAIIALLESAGAGRQVILG